jgi:hypothetical protein
MSWGHVVAQSVEALCYMPQSCMFFSWWSRWILSWPNTSSCTMASGSTQSLTEVSTRHLPGSKGWPAQGWQPHHRLWANCLDNVGASTFHNRMGLHGLLRQYLYLSSIRCKLYGLHLWVLEIDGEDSYHCTNVYHFMTCDHNISHNPFSHSNIHQFTVTSLKSEIYCCVSYLLNYAKLYISNFTWKCRNANHLTTKVW